MIAITGANGNLGKATITHLLQRCSPQNIVALVRNPSSLEGWLNEEVQVRIADYSDLHSMKKALCGVQMLLQISCTSTGEEGVQQEKNVVQAAVAAGVKHIVYTSSLRPDPEAEFLGSRLAASTEKAIMASGIGYTFFRNSLYMELVPQLATSAFYGGDIEYPASYGRVSFVSRDDIAEALTVLLSDQKSENRIYEITGAASWSFFEVAAMLKQEKGMPCRYIDIEEEEYIRSLKELELPEDAIELLSSMAKGISAGEFAFVDESLARILSRDPLPLKEFIRNL